MHPAVEVLRGEVRSLVEDVARDGSRCREALAGLESRLERRLTSECSAQQTALADLGSEVHGELLPALELVRADVRRLWQVGRLTASERAGGREASDRGS